MSDLKIGYHEVFTNYDADDNEVGWHFECSECARDVTDWPCPDHAPLTDLPGLRLIDCEAIPRHYTWAHQREDYGMPCPWCLLGEQHARDAEARQCRHRWWRRSRLFRWFSYWAYGMGIVSGSSHSTCDGCDWCVRLFWRGSRPYVLGVSRHTWRCWLKGRHRRGDDLGMFGFCSKCLPCPACGSKRFDHEADCPEAVTW